jgi:hypothetical protein
MTINGFRVKTLTELAHLHFDEKKWRGGVGGREESVPMGWFLGVGKKESI